MDIMILLVIIGIVLVIIYIILHKYPKWRLCFFGTDANKCTPAEIVKYLGVIGGGIIVVFTLYTAVRTNEIATKNNKLVEKGQIDTRFKDATILLSDTAISINMAAVYALHQIAVDASKDDELTDYVRVINDIFVFFINDNLYYHYNRNVNTDQTNQTLSFLPHDYFKKNTVVQAILNVLFQKESIYKPYNKKFKNCLFHQLNLNELELENVVFEYCVLNHLDVRNTKIMKTKFSDSFIQHNVLYNTSFDDVTIKGTKGSKIDMYVFLEEDSDKLIFPMKNVKFIFSRIIKMDFMYLSEDVIDNDDLVLSQAKRFYLKRFDNIQLTDSLININKLPDDAHKIESDDDLQKAVIKAVNYETKAVMVD